MALYQGVMFFASQEAPKGWSESWYSQGPSIQSVKSALEAIIPFRLAFLAETVYLAAYRMALVGGFRTYQTVVPGKAQFGQVKSPDVEPGDCFLYRTTGTNVPPSHRLVTFRGVPDDGIDGDFLTPTGVNYTAQADAYMRQVIANQFGMRQQDTSKPKVPVITIIKAVIGNNLTVTVGPGNVPPDGSLVRLRGVTNMPLLNGLWKTTGSTATGFDLVGSRNYDAVQSGHATVQVVSSVFDQIFTWGFDGVSFRKTGRPFGLGRGRAPKRVLHH